MARKIAYINECMTQKRKSFDYLDIFNITYIGLLVGFGGFLIMFLLWENVWLAMAYAFIMCTLISGLLYSKFKDTEQY